MEIKDSLCVALVQTDLFWEDIHANLASFEEKLTGINRPVDLILLPEMFSTGFTMTPEKVAEPMGLFTTKWLQQISVNYQALVIGSFVVKEGGQYYNRLLAVKPDGSFQHYDKRHLFRMGGEHDVYSGGKEKLILNWKGWNICPLICYDLRFPVWSRNTEENAYDLLVYVANWPAARSYTWRTLLRARAIENQTYVAGINRIGEDGKGVPHEGDSALIDYSGQPIVDMGNANELRIGEISRTQLIDYRKRFPAHLDADAFEINV